MEGRFDGESDGLDEGVLVGAGVVGAWEGVVEGLVVGLKVVGACEGEAVATTGGNVGGSKTELQSPLQSKEEQVPANGVVQV